MATTHSIFFSWDNVEALPDLHRLELKLPRYTRHSAKHFPAL